MTFETYRAEILCLSSSTWIGCVQVISLLCMATGHKLPEGLSVDVAGPILDVTMNHLADRNAECFRAISAIV